MNAEEILKTYDTLLEHYPSPDTLIDFYSMVKKLMRKNIELRNNHRVKGIFSDISAISKIRDMMREAKDQKLLDYFQVEWIKYVNHIRMMRNMGTRNLTFNKKYLDFNSIRMLRNMSTRKLATESKTNTGTDTEEIIKQMTDKTIIGGYGAILDKDPRPETLINYYFAVKQVVDQKPQLQIQVQNNQSLMDINSVVSDMNYFTNLMNKSNDQNIINECQKTLAMAVNGLRKAFGIGTDKSKNDSKTNTGN